MNKIPDDSVVADVYAGDATSPDPTRHCADSVFRFVIEADAQPDVWARMANLFNLANIAPLAATLHRRSPERVDAIVDMERISATTADMIRRKLLQLTCVTSVALSDGIGIGK